MLAPEKVLDVQINAEFPFLYPRSPPDHPQILSCRLNAPDAKCRNDMMLQRRRYAATKCRMSQMLKDTGFRTVTETDDDDDAYVYMS
jgi:hypothetical protein